MPGQGRQKRHLLAEVWQKGLSWLGWGPEGRRVSDRMLGAFLPMRTCWHCRKLPRKAVQALSLEAFKSCLDEVLSSPVWSHSWPSFELEVGLETSRHPFQPKFFYDPLKGVSSAVWFMWASVSIVTSELWSQDKEGICFFQVLPLVFCKGEAWVPPAPLHNKEHPGVFQESGFWNMGKLRLLSDIHWPLCISVQDLLPVIGRWLCHLLLTKQNLYWLQAKALKA